jgi:hypothetical protein
MSEKNESKSSWHKGRVFLTLGLPVLMAICWAVLAFGVVDTLPAIGEGTATTMQLVSIGAYMVLGVLIGTSMFVMLAGAARIGDLEKTRNARVANANELTKQRDDANKRVVALERVLVGIWNQFGLQPEMLINSPGQPGLRWARESDGRDRDITTDQLDGIEEVLSRRLSETTET